VPCASRPTTAVFDSRRERLVRYGARPPFARERIEEMKKGSPIEEEPFSRVG
jgi:hypothetical protein